MAAPFTDAQRQRLCEMMRWAFVELRALGAEGRGDQAHDLADAFHNLPTDLWAEHFSLVSFRDVYLVPYGRKYAPQGPHDYVGVINDIIAMEAW